jgi:hypothetical protein
MHAQNIIILRVKYKHALTQKKAEKEEAIKGIIDRGRETENENLQLILFMYVNLRLWLNISITWVEVEM